MDVVDALSARIDTTALEVGHALDQQLLPAGLALHAQDLTDVSPVHLDPVTALEAATSLLERRTVGAE